MTGLQYDVRVGCIAIYYGLHRNCLIGISKDPQCVYYASGRQGVHKDTKQTYWYIPWYTVFISKIIYWYYILKHTF